MYTEKIAYLYIENQVNHQSASSYFLIDKNQPSIELTVNWSFFNLRKGNDYFINFSIIRDGAVMVWNQQETPVDTKSMVSEPYDSMWAKYKPKISKPKVGTYQMTIELLNSKKDYVDSNTSYFEIALKDDENSSAKNDK
ncbi:hypothetical protein [Lentilactobacillus kefiri]|uniref:Uncharacterized protein n=2 Tax=Lentilactobacillus kefiri TaxID=33962 RepID=A0A8E1RIR3_LENKE|nr:hypothetical protein [Lentilactobacillus kefiri]KRL58216.1 hypothetical protein FD08_GL003713 [Lentilactobacillus parakefiri DSM 10551]KRM50412.1 hypothetical protein FC95_GL002049 [Lentilactobacillus kefiri DSM 20587 = JCM 5818]MCJ2162506.1 hypothetical protein [Lentilactobacillus kefiri]MCP9369515.1 hypothetical protein [Lentilactobacillus kefiri]MDH5109097.1 hypothetical protein [Lentilactobacillus kefiri]